MALTGCGSTSEPPAAPIMQTSTEDLQGRVIAMRVVIGLRTVMRVADIASEDPSQGIYRAQAQLYEVGHETDPANEAPRWWTVEDGLWKFDNCTQQ